MPTYYLSNWEEAFGWWRGRLVFEEGGIVHCAAAVTILILAHLQAWRRAEHAHYYYAFCYSGAEGVLQEKKKEALRCRMLLAWAAADIMRILPRQNCTLMRRYFCRYCAVTSVYLCRKDNKPTGSNHVCDMATRLPGNPYYLSDVTGGGGAVTYARRILCAHLHERL